VFEVDHGGPVVGKVFAERASGAGGDLRQIVGWIHPNVETDQKRAGLSDWPHARGKRYYAF
jgi:hypothetical protein